MFRPFYPHLRLKNVLELNVPRLQALGVECLLLDVDCTLKRYGSSEVPPEIALWISSLRLGAVRCCVVSNGHFKRIKQFADSIGLPFVAKALKPLPFGLRRAMTIMHALPDRTAFVGDQIFADVIAGRWAGVKTILV
ncbi:MAG: YqeG family HAD IIIA-type phosphatase, partial [Thermoguttaceae bacterium]